MTPIASFLLQPPKHILIRMPNWLGDLVMATPILADLRRHWPKTKITALCQNPLSTVIQEDPNIDHLITFMKPKHWFGSQSSRPFIQSLKQGDYDLGILLTNSFSSAFYFWKGNVKNRLGYAAHGRSLLLDYPVPFPKQKDSQHLVITYKMLLEPLGIPVSPTSPQLFLTSQEKYAVSQKLKDVGIHPSNLIIGINPGAAYGSAKCWLPERFKRVTEQLLENPKVKILYFGDKRGASLVEEICQGLPEERVFNLAGKTTLRELMAFIQSCHVFLTNDSGPMHVASALGIPLVALFGSTSEVTTSPYRGGHIIHKHVPCSPCYRRECPIDFRCMTRIEVKEVYEEIQKIVSL